MLRKSKDGEIKLTEPTRRKLTIYDQYICDGIFSYLEQENKITEAQVEKEEEKLEEKREEVEEKARRSTSKKKRWKLKRCKKRRNKRAS